jgi:hypothetical protein
MVEPWQSPQPLPANIAEFSPIVCHAITKKGSSTDENDLISNRQKLGHMVMETPRTRTPMTDATPFETLFRLSLESLAVVSTADFDCTNAGVNSDCGLIIPS